MKTVNYRLEMAMQGCNCLREESWMHRINFAWEFNVNSRFSTIKLHPKMNAANSQKRRPPQIKGFDQCYVHHADCKAWTHVLRTTSTILGLLGKHMRKIFGLQV
jgi:hypothetical protein